MNKKEAEILKLPICPICHDTKNLTCYLTAEPQYECRKCNTKWGYDYLQYPDGHMELVKDMDES